MDTSLQTIDRVRDSIIDMALHFGPKVLVALLILAAGYACGRWVGGLLGRMLERLHLDIPLRQLLVSIARIIVLGIFAIMALQNLGVDLLPLVAGLGVAGAGIALAMQGVLGNVAAGLTIIFTRPYHVGDYISIANEEGEVLEVTLFNTTLGHADRSRVIIPNRKIVGEILHNYGQIRQLHLQVGIPYGSDVAMVLDVAREVVRSNPLVLTEPTPVLGVARLGESDVKIAVAPWVKVPDHDAAISDLNQALLVAFAARQVAVAYPQVEVRMQGA